MKIEVHHRICDLLGVCPGDVVSVIGAGGKHTLMYHVALELYSVDIPVVLTSTTNLHRSAEYARLTTVRSEIGGIWEKDLDAALADGGRAVLVDAKLTPSMYRGIDPETVARVSTVVPGAVVLVKSDGARKRLLKAPGKGEPVYPPRVDICVLVLSLEAIGKPLNDKNVHRLERVRTLTRGAIVTAQTLVDVITAKGGYADSLAVPARHVLYLSCCVTLQAEEQARNIFEYTRDLFDACICGDTLTGRFYM